MITKKFEHQKIEKCKLSKNLIDTEKDDYTILLDCRGKEIESIGFYKHELLQGLLKGNLQKVNGILTNKYQKLASGMMGSLYKIVRGQKEFILGGKS